MGQIDGEGQGRESQRQSGLGEESIEEGRKEKEEE